MKKNLSMILVLATLFGMPAWAGNVPAGDEPARILSNGIQHLLVFIRQPGNRNALALEGFVKREIAPAFDFPYMSRWVAGPAARYMSEQQKQRFQAMFTQRFLKLMVGQLVKFSTQGPIQVLPSRRTSDKQALVTATLGNRRGYPAHVDFRMYRSPAGWKVFDVAANGSSVLAYFRRQLASQMPRRRAVAWR